METVRVVIAEDDVAQAEGIASLIRRLRPGWQVEELVHDRTQLIRSLEEVVPDVLLLDLHMPDRSSSVQSILEMVKATIAPPIVILITGDPSKALEAYESAVADYVVKPVKPVRLVQALERAETMLFARRGGRAGMAQAAAPAGSGSSGWLSGARGRDIVLLDPNDIIYLQAERKYTIAFLSDGQALMRFGISEIEAKLDMNVFLRIHRSTIVHRKRIDFLRRDEMGRLRVHMKGRSESLIVSRSFELIFKGA